MATHEGREIQVKGPRMSTNEREIRTQIHLKEKKNG